MSKLQEHLQAITGGSPPPIEQLWAMSGFSPNDAQREAILFGNGPLYLTAGPGSGKTRVLLWRTLNLIVYHSIPPHQIFLATFTEKAARQLEDGLRSLLGLVTNHTGHPYDLSGMYIGTVHSLCQKILSDRRRFFPDRHRPRPPSLLDDLGQYFFLYDSENWSHITTNAGLDPETSVEKINFLLEKKTSLSRHRAIQNLRPIFNRFSEELIEAEALNSRLDTLDLGKFRLEDVKLLLRLYQAYRDLLQRKKQTDFALLQQEAYHVLEAYEASGSVFRHIIVDEYQDTNTIQERIFFRLAHNTGNLCVVGDDDQALYRFRGATVENFVQFPQRCQKYLGKKPFRIDLQVNYRSRSDIVRFYSFFINQINWQSENGETTYRVDKSIHASRQDDSPAVVVSSADRPERACEEIAEMVRRLIEEGVVSNPNQIAFLYPSLKSEHARRMIAALEARGLQVYAPRAGRFLETTEAQDVFGILLHIFGRPSVEVRGDDLTQFSSWLGQIHDQGNTLQNKDPRLRQFVNDRRAEIQRVVRDYEVLQKALERNGWKSEDIYQPERMKRALYNTSNLSETARRLIASTYLDRLVPMRSREGNPLTLEYIIRRASSLDWNVLDLFYHLMGFEHFKSMFDQAEKLGDEGAVANLGMITRYLARFVEERVNVITGKILTNHKFTNIFFGSYLFALFRLGESELEDEENPFPRGRIPFLTIHQAKGLEFPVVVLGNLHKKDYGPPYVEELMRVLIPNPEGEPLTRMNQFDIARMFYVALSRPKNLLILPHFSGPGQRMSEPFPSVVKNYPSRIPEFDISRIPLSKQVEEDLPKVYSFTADYLVYQKCPRQYMIFRKFGFVPSRSQTMFFGSLVHRTLEDLHHELIRRRNMGMKNQSDQSD